MGLSNLIVALLTVNLIGIRRFTVANYFLHDVLFCFNLDIIGDLPLFTRLHGKGYFKFVFESCGVSIGSSKIGCIIRVGIIPIGNLFNCSWRDNIYLHLCTLMVLYVQLLVKRKPESNLVGKTLN